MEDEDIFGQDIKINDFAPFIKQQAENELLEGEEKKPEKIAEKIYDDIKDNIIEQSKQLRPEIILSE